MSAIEDFKSSISEMSPFQMDRFEIYDIMAAAFVCVCPFECRTGGLRDDDLIELIKQYKQSKRINRFEQLLEGLFEWSDYVLIECDEEEQKCLLFTLIRYIDSECPYTPPSTADSYEEFTSLNKKHKNVVRIVPRHENMISRLMSSAIAAKEAKDGRKKTGGLWGRNHANTRGINDCIHNFSFVLFSREIMPRFVVSNRSITEDLHNCFIRQNLQLKIAICPLSGHNLFQMFDVKLENGPTRADGHFHIEGPIGNAEETILERCRIALERCKQEGVNIVIFPEMLLTSKVVTQICNDLLPAYYISDNHRMPDLWFVWLGSVWENSENISIVIDGYGQKVLEHKKHVAFVHRDEATGRKYKEYLKKEVEPTLPFLDVPHMLRAATAICRDLTNDHLTTLTKELWADMMVAPAFSPVDRITNAHITPMIIEHVIAVICNACSAFCNSTAQIVDCIGKVGERIDFCYLGLPKKVGMQNMPHYYDLKFEAECKDCDQFCRGRIFTISFTECADEGYTPKVVEA